MDRRFSLDRIEEDIAVLIEQGGGTFHVLAGKLPPLARDGDVLALRSGTWTILREETDKLRKEMFDLQESLFEEQNDHL